MNEGLDKKLVTTFPLLYRDRYGDLRSTCMVWGFPFSDESPGWFDLLWSLSSKLEPLIQKYIDEEKPTDCAQCGCEQKLHEEVWEGGEVNPLNRQCWNIHYLPYRFSWKWSSVSWPSKSHNWSDRWKVFKAKYVRHLFVERIKYWIARSINSVLELLHEQFGVTKKLPCHCKKYLLNHPCASQVKEKYGTLRFYMTSGTDEMYQLIREAEDKSAVTCEECGSVGKIRDGGWLVTLCDKCDVERKSSDTWYDVEDETSSDEKE